MWKLRIGKYCNLLKILSGYIFSLLFRRALHWGDPFSISIEPTNLCNLRCPECPTGQNGLTRSSGTLDPEKFRLYLDQAGKRLMYLVLYFQGEPYLNNNLFDLISYAKSKQIYVWTSTNGHFLTEDNILKTIESGLDKLIISLDGADQEAYEKYRVGGSYETVVEGIRNFVRIRKETGSQKPKLEIQCLVLKSNQHQIKEIKKLGNSLGVDRTILKTAQFYDFKHGNPLMPDAGKYSRYRQEVRSPQSAVHSPQSTVHSPQSPVTSHQSPVTSHQSPVTSHQSPVTSHQSPVTGPLFEIKNPLRNRCFRMWSSCVITWDGKVVPCCFDKDADHGLGDLNQQSFEEIWRGEKYREFRKKILSDRKSIDICRNCSQRW